MDEKGRIEIQFAISDRDLAAATWDALDSKAGVLLAVSVALIAAATFITDVLARGAIFIGAGLSLILLAISVAPYSFDFLEAEKYACCVEHTPDNKIAKFTRLYIEDRDEKIHERNRLKKNLVYAAVLLLTASGLITAISGILDK
jgi:hypothetical protein